MVLGKAITLNDQSARSPWPGPSLEAQEAVIKTGFFATGNFIQTELFPRLFPTLLKKIAPSVFGNTPFVYAATTLAGFFSNSLLRSLGEYLGDSVSHKKSSFFDGLSKSVEECLYTSLFMFSGSMASGTVAKIFKNEDVAKKAFSYLGRHAEVILQQVGINLSTSLLQISGSLFSGEMPSASSLINMGAMSLSGLAGASRELSLGKGAFGIVAEAVHRFGEVYLGNKISGQETNAVNLIYSLDGAAQRMMGGSLKALGFSHRPTEVHPATKQTLRYAKVAGKGACVAAAGAVGLGVGIVKSTDGIGEATRNALRTVSNTKSFLEPGFVIATGNSERDFALDLEDIKGIQKGFNPHKPGNSRILRALYYALCRQADTQNQAANFREVLKSHYGFVGPNRMGNICLRGDIAWDPSFEGLSRMAADYEGREREFIGDWFKAKYRSQPLHGTKASIVGGCVTGDYKPGELPGRMMDIVIASELKKTGHTTPVVEMVYHQDRWVFVQSRGSYSDLLVKHFEKNGWICRVEEITRAEKSGPKAKVALSLEELLGLDHSVLTEAECYRLLGIKNLWRKLRAHPLTSTLIKAGNIKLVIDSPPTGGRKVRFLHPDIKISKAYGEVDLSLDKSGRIVALAIEAQVRVEKRRIVESLFLSESVDLGPIGPEAIPILIGNGFLGVGQEVVQFKRETGNPNAVAQKTNEGLPPMALDLKERTADIWKRWPDLPPHRLRLHITESSNGLSLAVHSLTPENGDISSLKTTHTAQLFKPRVEPRFIDLQLKDGKVAIIGWYPLDGTNVHNILKEHFSLDLPNPEIYVVVDPSLKKEIKVSHLEKVAPPPKKAKPEAKKPPEPKRPRIVSVGPKKPARSEEAASVLPSDPDRIQLPKNQDLSVRSVLVDDEKKTAVVKISPTILHVDESSTPLPPPAKVVVAPSVVEPKKSAPVEALRPRISSKALGEWSKSESFKNLKDAEIGPITARVESLRDRADELPDGYRTFVEEDVSGWCGSSSKKWANAAVMERSLGYVECLSETYRLAIEIENTETDNRQAIAQKNMSTLSEKLFGGLQTKLETTSLAPLTEKLAQLATKNPLLFAETVRGMITRLKEISAPGSRSNPRAALIDLTSRVDIALEK